MAAYEHGIPNPLENAECQELLKLPNIHSSWLRKYSFRNKLKMFSWPHVFVVLHNGCLYYYRNEMSKAPVGCFTLYGYNFVQRDGEFKFKENPWAFKIVHTHKEYRTYIFSAASEQEMKIWMKKIKHHLQLANKKLIRSEADGRDSDLESQTYQDIESKIYASAEIFKVPASYGNKKEEEDSDDDLGDVYSRRPPVAPPVPPRTRASMDRSSLVREMTNKLSHLSIDPTSGEKKRKPPKMEPKPTGIIRGNPDGASIKREVTETYQDATSVEEETEDDAESYWKSIYYVAAPGAEKNAASEIIRNLGEEGVYLVRDGSGFDDSQVLVVFAGGMPRKYKIKHIGSKYCLQSKTPEYFDSVEDLVYHYYFNNLPTVPITLCTPFKNHRDYHKST